MVLVITVLCIGVGFLPAYGLGSAFLKMSTAYVVAKYNISNSVIKEFCDVNSPVFKHFSYISEEYLKLRKETKLWTFGSFYILIIISTLFWLAPILYVNIYLIFLVWISIKYPAYDRYITIQSIAIVFIFISIFLVHIIYIGFALSIALNLRHSITFTGKLKNSIKLD